jgi:hypothetical protein
MHCVVVFESLEEFGKPVRMVEGVITCGYCKFVDS